MPTERLAAAGLAHVPENRLVFPTLSVEDHLALGGWTRRRGPRAETESQRQRALDLFPRLQTRRRQPTGTLSGGDQQMLAIARGLMARPKLLVLDAFKVADRVYVTDRGDFAMDGNPSELLADQRVHQAYLGGGYTT